MSARARLAELGLELPSVVPPVAAYVPAVRSGNHVFTSGQLPMVQGELPATGKVGAQVSAEQAKELAAYLRTQCPRGDRRLVGLTPSSVSSR